MKKNKEGVLLSCVSIIAVVLFITCIEKTFVFAGQTERIRNEVWECEMADITHNARQNIIDKWTAHQEEVKRLEEERIERERIAQEIEETVWWVIANYTSNEATQNYIYYAWQQFGWYGWSTYDLECLVTLWHRESRWNPLAHNSSSGAHGIPQSLPAEKMASYGADYWDNGYTQILWGLDYIARRYGSPANALSHSYAHGWY